MWNSRIYSLILVASSGGLSGKISDPPQYPSVLEPGPILVQANMPFSNPFPDVPSSNTLEPRWRLVFKDGTAGYSLTIKDNDADADENKHKDENKDKEKNKDEDRTSKDYNDETADTIIVSSDGVKFWIPSYVLKFGR